MKRILFSLLMLATIEAQAVSQSIVLSPGDVVTITAAPQGGGTTPPTPPSIPPQTGSWDGKCAGFARTLVVDLDWNAPQRKWSPTMTNGVNFLRPDVMVVRFTTGSVSTTGSLVTVSGAEYNSPPSWRIATLSATPCDFGPQPAMGANITGNSVTAKFALGTGTGFGYYPVLPLNTVHYLNIKNDELPTCAATLCDMFVDLLKPGGL